MASQRGSDVLLYIGDGGNPENFNLVGGLLNIDFSFSSTLSDVTNITSNNWREILDSQGKRFVVIDASGRYTGAATENLLRTGAFTNKITNFEIRFGSGDVLSGSFKIMDYTRSGAIKNSETYSVSLESSGEVSYVAA